MAFIRVRPYVTSCIQPRTLRVVFSIKSGASRRPFEVKLPPTVHSHAESVKSNHLVPLWSTVCTVLNGHKTSVGYSGENYAMTRELDKCDAAERDEPLSDARSRRDFLRTGGLGLGGMAGAVALGVQTSGVQAQESRDEKKRVAILFDSWNHMMPALAREMVRRNHNLVLGDARDKELVKELRGMGATVEVVEDTEDQSKSETFQKLVDRAENIFGGFHSACIRTGTHVNASVLTGDDRDLETVYEGNLKSVFYALRAVVPPLVVQS